MDTTALDRLAAKLTSPGAEPLADAERALLIAALSQLAADQSLIARQRRLLSARAAGDAEIDALLAPTLAALAEHAASPHPGVGPDMDPTAAHRRREALAAAAESATSAREIVRAVLGFVHAAASVAL